jgi:hypothetical protein
MSINHTEEAISYLFKQSRLTNGISSGFLSKRTARTSVLSEFEVDYKK